MSGSETKQRCDCACKGAGPMVTEFLRRMGPSEAVRQHFSQAQLEVLKGIRAFLDEQITAHTSQPGTGTRIPVE